MTRLDPHSVADGEQPQIVRLRWRARIDGAARVVAAEATLELAEAVPAATAIDLDSRTLTLVEVVASDGKKLEFELGPTNPVLGARLRVHLPAGTRAFTVAYRTSPKASALAWSTDGVYSQCQPTHARALVPLVDSPTARLAFEAEVSAPASATVLMGAALVDRRVDGDRAITRYRLDRAIPPYGLALAVGRVESRELGPRSRVWAPADRLDDAARVLAPVERWLGAAEALLGPYAWERFDLYVAPASFPYGGMENPRLAFVAPSLLEGDVAAAERVVVHELAHAWLGNEVTAANAEHLFLNEGFAVWAERRLLEALHDASTVALHVALGRTRLDRALLELSPERTPLRRQLENVHPDEASSVIAYEKGWLLLHRLELGVGRPRFDAFVRAYLDRFRGRAVTTEALLAFVDEALAGHGVDLARWAFSPGLPDDAPPPPAIALGDPASFSSLKWQLYFARQPSLDVAALDRAHALTVRRDPELLSSWLAVAIAAGHEPALLRAHGFVGETGRLTLLAPVWRALAAQPSVRDELPSLFQRVRAGYHPIAEQAIESLLRHAGIATREVNPLGLGLRRPL